MHIYIQRKKLQKKLQKTTKLKVLSKITKIIDTLRCAKKANLYKGNYQGHEGAREQPKRQLKCLELKFIKSCVSRNFWSKLVSSGPIPSLCDRPQASVHLS